MNKSCDCHICVHASVFLGAEPCLPCHPDENGGTNFEPREYPEYKTLQEIVDQLVWCGYECEGGPLRLNTAFIALQKRAENEISAKDARIKELEAECNVLGNSLATRMERERGLLQALELIHVDQETVDKKVPCLVEAATNLLTFLEDKGECEICTQGSYGDEGGVFFELDPYDRVALPHEELAKLHETLDKAINEMEGGVKYG